MMRNSPYSTGGHRGQERDFLQGRLTELDESLKPYMTLAVFHAGKISEGLNLLEHSALKEQSFAGCHRKQSQTVSGSINGED